MKKLAWLALALAYAGDASAHAFGRPYTLPVPFWLYAYGASAALILSFLVVAWFVTAGSAQSNFRVRELDSPVARALAGPAAAKALAGLGVAGLLLTIASGLFGTPNPYANFSMTFFWIVFALGFTYLTALVGDLYAAANPWRAMVQWFQPRAFAGRMTYPSRRGYFPAFALYMAFIWIELFGRTTPRSLALILAAYTAVNFAAAWLVGAAAWFRYGEFFSVFFRVIAKIAPLERVDGRLRLRHPFVGLLAEPAESFSLLLFVLFMIASTAFDGFRDTVPCVGLFWRSATPALMWLFDNDGVRAYPVLQQLYLVYGTLGLLLSPLVYLAIYLLFVRLAKFTARTTLPVRELALRFAFSLVPIALSYNLAHYFTLLLSQGLQVVRLVSDPLGRGWDLFGTARWSIPPALIDAGTIWHTQVALILAGHIAGVYLAHLEALKIFPTRRAAALSQLPMLLLMVAYTTIGLWILSLPIQPA